LQCAGIVATISAEQDLGYPTGALRRDGSLYVAYYAQDSDGVTKIMADVVRLPQRKGGPMSHVELRGSA